MTGQLPFASREVRWFFEGPLAGHPALEDWFFGCAPFPLSGDVAAPSWQPRRNDEPDIYLLLPGREDMGIKWREGLLQIKGRVAALGEEEFGARHAGRVERWIKWTYGDLPDAYAELFGSPALATVAVRKLRATRFFDLAPGTPVEVGPDVMPELGMGAELTRLTVRRAEFCSLGFEAYPDGRLGDGRFEDAVARFLDSLDALRLDAVRSMSYATWLNRLQDRSLGI